MMMVVAVVILLHLCSSQCGAQTCWSDFLLNKKPRVLSAQCSWSFAAQKFSILMLSSQLIFPFMDCAFGVVSKKSLPHSRPLRFSPKSCSKRSIVFYLCLGL